MTNFRNYSLKKNNSRNTILFSSFKTKRPRMDVRPNFVLDKDKKNDCEVQNSPADSCLSSYDIFESSDFLNILVSDGDQVEEGAVGGSSKMCGANVSTAMLTKITDPDYPKTTFHIDPRFTQTLFTPSTNGHSDIFPSVPSIFDLMGYSSDDSTPGSLTPIHQDDGLDKQLCAAEQLLSATRRALSPSKQDLEHEILQLTRASDLLNSSHSSEEDLHSLSIAMERLQMSGWYYRNVSRHQVKSFLKDGVIGSFLVRDSTDPHHLFALSVRTPRGTTSVRIEYDNGQFHLDCEDCLRCHMPVFSCIVKLVNFYIRMGRNESMVNPCVWLETSGKRDMPVKLTQPLRRELPSLKHLSRLKICASLPLDLPAPHGYSMVNDHIDTLPLPNPLKRYLKQYPYAN